jgi:HK97 family phage major capsid protein
MSGFPEIIEAIRRQGVAFEGFVTRSQKTLDEIRERHDSLTQRLEEIETKGNMPAKSAGGETAEGREHKQRFLAWLRRPNDSTAKNALSDFESQALSKKAISIGSSADGGFAVPEQIARDIEKLEKQYSPVRNLVRVTQIGTSDYKQLLSLRGASSGWVGESTSRGETVTPKLREIVPTMGEIYAYPQTTEWALDDVFFDVAGWLADEVADTFSIAEGSAVISGDGSNKPTGMVHTAPVATADFASPLRAAAAYQYVACLATNSPAVAEILPDALVDLVYSVNSRYRANGTFVMNSNTAAKVRKLKDANGNYVWAPGLISGQPDSLLGYPVQIWEQLDDVGTNKLPIAFGDFKRGYLLVERSQIRITVDANITTPGKIKYFVRRREGGIPLNNDAVKFLKTTIA